MSHCNQLGHPDQPLGLRRIRGAVFFSVLGTKFQGFAFLVYWQKGNTSQFQVTYTDYPASMMPSVKEKGFSSILIRSQLPAGF